MLSRLWVPCEAMVTQSMSTTQKVQESRQIEVLRWPLIVLVVFIHANNDRVGTFAPEGGVERYTHLVRQFLSEGVAATAVPLFFLLAGRLYFKGPRFGASHYRSKLRARVRTLLVPYLGWNLLLAFAFAAASRVEALGSVVSGRQAQGLFESPSEAFATVFGVGRDPIAYPLWFLRDLMLVVTLLTPLFAFGYRTAPALFALVLGVPWLLHAWPLESFSVVGPLFFFIGGWFGWNERPMFPPSNGLARWALLWVTLLSADFLGFTGDFYPYVRQIGLAAGIVTMLALASLVGSRPALAGRLSAAAPFAFFLYAAHEPLLTLLGRMGGKVLAPLTPLDDLAIYFGSVAFVVAALTLVQKVLGRMAPRALRLLTGGR